MQRPAPRGRKPETQIFSRTRFRSQYFTPRCRAAPLFLYQRSNATIDPKMIGWSPQPKPTNPNPLTNKIPPTPIQNYYCTLELYQRSYSHTRQDSPPPPLYLEPPPWTLDGLRFPRNPPTGGGLDLGLFEKSNRPSRRGGLDYGLFRKSNRPSKRVETP